ncbi:MAG: hypothetical protein LBD50_02005 [Rickettsiales bacterium]|nr:hypothetical protein [Rickettsiales bacterium]
MDRINLPTQNAVRGNGLIFMLIGFTSKSSKILPRILCKNFRHCIVLFNNRRRGYILAQIALDGVRLVPIGAHEIKKLQSAGWIFVKSNPKKSRGRPMVPNFLTCVGFAKRALGINKPFIWTPDQLYKYLNNRK